MLVVLREQEHSRTEQEPPNSPHTYRLPTAWVGKVFPLHMRGSQWAQERWDFWLCSAGQGGNQDCMPPSIKANVHKDVHWRESENLGFQSKIQ